MERDLSSAINIHCHSISTHTLTWSVTAQTVSCQIAAKISTHTLTWSVTISLAKIIDVTAISTHTLTWSVTLRVTVQYIR